MSNNQLVCMYRQRLSISQVIQVYFHVDEISIFIDIRDLLD
jgi:hypothetical protein